MRNFFSKVLLVASSLILNSCGDPIEDNSRLGIDVMVQDASGNPIENIAVQSVLSESILFVSSFTGTLGVATTNDEGIARLISFEPVSDTGFSVIINGEDDTDSSTYNPLYNTIVYSLDSLDTRDFALPIAILRRPSRLNLTIENVSGSQDTLVYSLNYQTPAQLFNKEGDLLSETSTASGQLGTDSEIEERFVTSLEGTNATFFYRRFNGELLEEETIIIPITFDSTDFTYEY